LEPLLHSKGDEFLGLLDPSDFPTSRTQQYVFQANYRCPVDPRQEPTIGGGIGISAAQSESYFSHTFVSDFCDFPVDPWVVDRTSYGALGSALGSTLFPGSGIPPSQELCQVTNSPDTFNVEAFPDFLGVRFTPSLNLKTYLDENGHLPREIKNLHQLRNCARMVQTAYCNQFCPQYNVDRGIFVTLKSAERFQKQCGEFVNPYALILGGADPEQLQALEKEGIFIKTQNPFERIPPTEKFFREYHYTDPCTTLGLPYVDTCNGECTVIFSDVNHCGKCGNVCGAGLICDSGLCILDPDDK